MKEERLARGREKNRYCEGNEGGEKEVQTSKLGEVLLEVRLRKERIGADSSLQERMSV